MTNKIVRFRGKIPAIKQDCLPVKLQIQGTREHFKDTCGGVIAWLDSKTYYTAFLEGWGLYAENPLISDDTDVYIGRPMKKYGMLKWQV